jgi:hypothetical protein
MPIITDELEIIADINKEHAICFGGGLSGTAPQDLPKKEQIYWCLDQMFKF